ncbi:TetR/AcrR family transcriptional regulator [Cellulomonas fimi]|uniref:TetR/AcrR family transcriptional regulator n=1 Tax=Cellulomonas fimi TaxID=1708 RepID=A0A7Y0LYH1_CELFI|nr:TetR/AcrR family transcriptional regulator [Cellulomonas fimi]NMR19072.1 TetR/AcrR family transcriptional regulator [Cellulomonas fimi]
MDSTLADGPRPGVGPDPAVGPGPGPGAGDRPLRSDAARNRDRIVTAARELFASRGLGVGLNEVAHHAGLGVGTVYRRFPDKQVLVDAVLEEPLRQMRAVAVQAEGAERAWDGLTLLLSEGAALLTANLGLRDVALSPDGDEPTVSALRADLAQVSDRLLVRAREEGDVRPGVTGDDIAVLFWMLSELAEHSAEARPDAYRRYLQLLTDGLRSGPGREELSAPLDRAEVAEISRRWAGR